jgi:integrase
VPEVSYWESDEVQTILDLAREHEPRFAPLFHFLVATGARRGEALGLQWSDIDFMPRRICLRRSITNTGLSTPKNGRGRVISIPEGLVDDLQERLTQGRREGLSKGWSEIPEWVFSSEEGTMPDPANVGRCWRRLRRRAHAVGVRPLKLHCARHTWATLALRAGKSVRWVADQLGHADPALTLRVYAHAMREEENDLFFAEFGSSSKWLETALSGSEAKSQVLGIP